MSTTTDRTGDNRWNQCQDALVAAWNRAGPDATLAALTALELGPADCRLPCDIDCEIAPVHCWNWHRPNHKADWHDPAACDAGKNAATREAG